MKITYDRRVDPEFLDLFVESAGGGGVVASLVANARFARFPVDLQFRRDTTKQTASLYVGLTAVLNLHMTGERLWMTTHETHQNNGRFERTWTERRSRRELTEIWPDVERYLDRIIPIAAQTHGRKEGAVQAAISSFPHSRMAFIDRELTPGFEDTNVANAFMRACELPIVNALRNAELDFGQPPRRLGNECDALAVDADGRVLAVEVKPLGVGTIAWVAAQATMYARIMQGWATSAGSDAAAVLIGMFNQRAKVGLLGGSITVADTIEVVPVVALQRGASPELIRRMLAVRDVLAADPEVEGPPVEIFEVSLNGELTPLDGV